MVGKAGDHMPGHDPARRTSGRSPFTPSLDQPGPTQIHSTVTVLLDDAELTFTVIPVVVLPLMYVVAPVLSVAVQ